MQAEMQADLLGLTTKPRHGGIGGIRRRRRRRRLLRGPAEGLPLAGRRGPIHVPLPLGLARRLSLAHLLPLAKVEVSPRRSARRQGHVPVGAHPLGYSLSRGEHLAQSPLTALATLAALAALAALRVGKAPCNLQDARSLPPAAARALERV